MATAERKALSQDIEKTGFKLVDQAAWWITRLLVVTLASLFIGALLFLFLIKKFFFSSQGPYRWVPRDLPRQSCLIETIATERAERIDEAVMIDA
jgi:hypothetical protein